MGRLGGDAAVLTDLTLGSAAISIGRTGERLPELWTYPYFQRATAYSARHEDANSYYNVSGLQAKYGRSYAFESGAGRMTQLSRPWGGW